MSDLEAGGALVTAALAASEIDANKKKGRAHHPERTNCANCNAKLSGVYCQRCGQSSHVHRSLWHMLEESLHGVLHFDTKSWRTLPLLIARPGLLTRRYIEGQRVRYVSPLALFLFSVFLMFFAFSFVKDPTPSVAAVDEVKRAEIRAELSANVAESQKAAAEQQAITAPHNTNAAADAAAALADAQFEQRVAEAALSAFDKAAQASAAANTSASVTNTAKTSPLATLNIETGSAKLDKALRHGLENPEFLLYKLKNTAYKFSFMLIPISLPFMWLMFFWRRGVRVYDHAVFSLYSLSFMSLFFVSVTLVGLIPGAGKLATIVVLAPPLHMFLQLRETYSLGIWSTLWRTVALLCVAGTVFVLFMLMIAAISMT